MDWMGRMQCAARVLGCTVVWLIHCVHSMPVVSVVLVVYCLSSLVDLLLPQSVQRRRDLVVECECLVRLGMASWVCTLVVCLQTLSI